MTPEEITPAWLSAVVGAEVRGVTQDRIGDGLVGMNLRLGLEYAGDRGERPESLVIKLPSPDPTSRATGVAMRNYEREVLFYRDVASTVDMCVAQCHFAEWDPATGDFALLLEDLSPAAQGDQVRGCTIEQARTAVLELAKLHGPRWDDPTLHDLEWLGRRAGPEDAERLTQMWSVLTPGFLDAFARHLSPEAIELVHAFGPRLGDWVEGRTGPWALTHGDYRLDNLMFATPAGGHPVAAVDWQTPGHGPPTADVSYFLGAGVLPHERRAIERDLVEEYGAALVEYGVSVESDWLWEQYRRDAFAGLIMAVLASQVVGVSERSEAMFTAMATRHAQHAIDVEALSLI